MIVGDDGATRTRSYGELVVAVEGFAARLVSRGVRRGERVAIAAPDPEYLVVATLGALRAGLVPVVLTDPHGQTAEVWRAGVMEVMRASEAQRVIRPSVRGSMPLLGELREVAVDDLGEHPLGPVFLANPASFKDDDLALVACTMDRTGAARATSYTHATLAEAAEAALGETQASDKLLSWVGLDRGLVSGVLAPLRARLPFVIARPDRLDAGRWLRLVDQLGATITIAERPTLLRADKRAQLPGVRVLAHDEVPVVRKPAATGEGTEPRAEDTVRAVTVAVEASTSATAAETASAGASSGGAMGHGVKDMSAPTTASRGPGETDVSIPTAASRGPGGKDMSHPRVSPAQPIGWSMRHGEEDMSGSARPVVRAPSGPWSIGRERRTPLSPAHAEPGSTLAPAGGVIVWRFRGEDGAGEVAFARGEQTGAEAIDVIVVQGCSYDPQPIEREAARVPGICAGQVVALARPGKLSDELVLVAEGRAVDRAVFNTMAATLRRRIQAALGLRVAALVQVPVGALPRTTGGELQRAEARELYASQAGA